MILVEPEEPQRAHHAPAGARAAVTGILSMLSALGAIVFAAMLVVMLAEAHDAYRRNR